ncbi:MAG: hypothetical protein LBB86_01120 [Oscillospiraceae bacterium]|jgi:hypothetical protein|nr:hypothetical protein [Oscillospiraceae bacterium]
MDNDDDDDNDDRYPHDDCRPDFCPAFGVAATILSKQATIKAGDFADIKNLASYAFNLSTNRDKSKFLVKKSGFYAIGYFIGGCFYESEFESMSAQIYVERCNRALGNPIDSNDEWKDSATDIGPVLAKFACSTNAGQKSRYTWAVRSQYLNKGDRVKIRLVNNGAANVNVLVQIAGFVAIRLTPCSCIPPGGLPAINLTPMSLSPILFGEHGLNLPIDLNPFRGILGVLLSDTIATVLPALLKDSLPDILQGYQSREAVACEDERGGRTD